MNKKTTVEIKAGGYVNEFATQDDKFIYHTHQDVQPVIEHAKVLGEQTPGKDFRHVAEIPMVIYQKAVREGWAEDKKKFKQWLNDPDNKMFRSWKGRV